MAIGIEQAGTAPAIPHPPRPANDGDVADPSIYIPESLSENERTELREAAQHWAGTLGGVFARNSGTLGVGPDSGQAADHMNHFLNGDGEDLNLSWGDMREIRTTVDSVGDFENTQLQSFLELVRADFAGGGSPHRQYLSKNESPSSPNYGENWFALSEERGKKWFFALGSFWIAYGAHAFLAVQNQFIRIHYRMFLYDRYNWDVGKATAIPGGMLSWLIDDDLMGGIEDLTGPTGLPYFQIERDADENVTQYGVNDSLLGSLVTTGDADHYDIVGAGYVRSVQFPIDAPPAGTIPPARPSITDRS